MPEQSSSTIPKQIDLQMSYLSHLTTHSDKCNQEVQSNCVAKTENVPKDNKDMPGQT